MAEKNRQWILVKRPNGPLTDDCFELREGAVPVPKAGEFVVRNELLSCDPTQRAWIEIDTYLPKIPLGDVVRGAAASKVVASNHPDFAVGDMVQGTNLIINRATMRGFLVLDYLDRAMEAVGHLVQWSQAGTLANAVDVAEGLERTPQAFRNLFTGGNIGKQLVRIAQ